MTLKDALSQHHFNCASFQDIVEVRRHDNIVEKIM